LISQIVGYAGLWLIMKSGGGMDTYYQNAILFTGLTGLLAMIPCLWFYSRDRAARKIGGLVTSQKPWQLKIPEMLLLLGMGAAFSQFANMLVGILQSVLNYQEYQESMDQLMEGKQMWFLILSMGIIAPLAEEIVFRWLIYLRLRDYMRMGAAERLHAGSPCDGDFGDILWNLSWKSGTGCLCEPSWNSVCIYSGYQWMSVEQCAIAYGG